MFTKNVVLVGHDYGDLVPRGAKREQLHDAGQIANLVEIFANWNEEVYKTIEHRFQSLIDISKPFPRYYNDIILQLHVL